MFGAKVNVKNISHLYFNMKVIFIKFIDITKIKSISSIAPLSISLLLEKVYVGWQEQGKT